MAALETPPELLLVAAVATVGVLHTIVPDHWVPITLLARQRGWSTARTARTASVAGLGHVASTLLIGALVYVAGAAAAARFGHLVDTAASLALVGFGLWIAVSAWRQLDAPHRHDHGHHHDHGDHHHHGPHDDHHDHDHDHHHGHHHDRGGETSSRTALLLILGSSPMVEGLPAFFAAGKFGPGLIVTMAVVFAVATIATYVLLCVLSTIGLQRVTFGRFERYGEVLSGAFIAVVGVAFWIWPVM